MSNKRINDGGQAFPVPGFPADRNFVPHTYGMTKREAYAMAALAGICADENTLNAENAATFAASCADALIAELEKETHE